MSEPSNGTGIREHVLLFSRFLRSPRTVGALTASSRALAEAMVEGLDLSRPGRIVELLGPDTRFLAMDIDPAFVRQIQKRWPAVECVCASAECLDSLASDRGM